MAIKKARIPSVATPFPVVPRLPAKMIYVINIDVMIDYCISEDMVIMMQKRPHGPFEIERL